MSLRRSLSLMIGLMFMASFGTAYGGQQASPAPASGTVAPTPVPPTATPIPPAAIPPTPTATAGIGVPVVGGNWEMIVNGVRREAQLPSAFLTTVAPKSGNAFIVMVITFRNLDSTLPTEIPEGNALFMRVKIYTTKTAPPTAIHLRDVTLITDDGTTSPVVGWGVGDVKDYFLMGPGLLIGDDPNPVNVADLKVESGDAKSTYSFAFEVPDSAIKRQLKLQYQKLPAIPFTVRASP